MRLSFLPVLAVALFASACGIRVPASPIAPGTYLAAPAPSLTGNVGGRPFVARSAIMLRPTHWGNGGYTQTLRIYERNMDCAHADEMNWGDGAIPGERFVQVAIGGQWPMFPSSVWQAQLGESHAMDGSGIDIFFETVPGGGGASGAGMTGQMRVLQATRGAGVIWLQASRTREDPHMRNVQDIDPNELGSVSGNVSFLVCEGGRGG